MTKFVKLTNHFKAYAVNIDPESVREVSCLGDHTFIGYKNSDMYNNVTESVDEVLRILGIEVENIKES